MTEKSAIMAAIDNARAAFRDLLSPDRAREIRNGTAVRELLVAEQDIYAPALCAAGVFVRGRGPRGPGDPRIHGGMDIAADLGTLIYAPRSAVIEHSANVIRGYGEMMIGRCRDGTAWWICHLDARLIEAGDTVLGGQPIARMGRTSNPGAAPENIADHGTRHDARCGHFPTMGPHVHFGVSRPGDRSLPVSYSPRGALSSPKEVNFGIDPANWLRANDVQMFAAPRER